MYDFSGVIFRIWGVCGVLVLLSVSCIFLEKKTRKDFKLRKCKGEFATIAFAVCLGLVYLSRIIFPDVASYTGDFLYVYRNSSSAPLTYEYTFWSGEGKKQGLYIDIYSEKRVFPDDLEKGQKYVVYYDKFTRVIVKIHAIQ